MILRHLHSYRHFIFPFLCSGGPTGAFFNAVGPSSAGAGGTNLTSPLTWSHTCAGSNRVLIVGINWGPGSLNDSTFAITSVTYNGVAMTLVPSSLTHTNNINHGFCVMYYLVAPATGANNVVVTWTNSGPNAGDGIGAGSLGFTGVNQTTPFSNLATAFGNSTATSVAVTSAVGNIVVDVTATGSNITANGQTLGWQNNVNQNSGGGCGAQQYANGAASVTLTYTHGSDEWAIAAINLIAG